MSLPEIKLHEENPNVIVLELTDLDGDTLRILKGTDGSHVIELSSDAVECKLRHHVPPIDGLFITKFIEANREDLT